MPKFNEPPSLDWELNVTTDSLDSPYFRLYQMNAPEEFKARAALLSFHLGSEATRFYSDLIDKNRYGVAAHNVKEQTRRQRAIIGFSQALQMMLIEMVSEQCALDLQPWREGGNGTPLSSKQLYELLDAHFTQEELETASEYVIVCVRAAMEDEDISVAEVFGGLPVSQEDSLPQKRRPSYVSPPGESMYEAQDAREMMKTIVDRDGGES